MLKVLENTPNRLVMKVTQGLNVSTLTFDKSSGWARFERAVLLCEEGVIHSYHLPPTLQTGKESGTVPALSLEDAVARLEKEMIIDALKNTRGNITSAAEILNTTVRKFAYKAQKYGVDYKNYR